MIEPGTLIDGRYKVLSRIGSGGMADVYLAEDQLLGRRVAVKLLQHRFSEDQEFVERFRREASSAAGLSHPNVVAIFDRGEWDGTYYIAMEYLPGRSLKAIAREGPLEVATAVDIVIQILRAARFAHRRGIIHRDIKPHNVILDEEGRAKVTDFGIARAGASDMTLTGSIMGTAQYLSPEQAQGQAVSEASDIYAIGIVLYELLTGAIPFDGETAVSIALKQVSAPPPVPSALNPVVPAALDAVVVRALAKDPRQRFANADAFIAALEEVAKRLGPPTPVAAAVGAQTVAVGAGEATAVTPPPTAIADVYSPAGSATGELLLAEDDAIPPRRRRRRALLILLALLIIAGGAVALVLALRKNDVAVPSLVGFGRKEAEARLEHAQLYFEFERQASATERVGRVLASSPGAGTQVPRWSTVKVFVSSGPRAFQLPNVATLAPGAAITHLKRAGVKTVHVVHRTSATVPSGEVIGTTPEAFSEVPVGQAVTLIVSSGPAPVNVPEVTGQSLAEARTTLVGDGLQVCSITRYTTSEASPGTVLSQSPSEGQLARGSCVDLTVAATPTTVTVPYVLELHQARAASEIGAAGLSPYLITRPVSERSENERVLVETPAAGSTVKRGTTVTLTIGVYERPPEETPTATTTVPSEPTTEPEQPAVTGPAEVP